MDLLGKPQRMMIRILVFGTFCVTMVSMQTRVGRQTEAADTFTSAQYPNTGFVDEAWEITVDQNHQILLQFMDFSLNETTSCTLDVLELYDGGRFDNVLIDRFCWDNATILASTAYVSTGNQLYLRLITAEGYSRKGYQAHYISVDLQNTYSSGELTSPGYPNTRQLVDEAWRIQVNEGHQIRLEFLDFALHMSVPCVYDYFEIYDGVSNRYCLLERWCWKSLSELPQTVYISTGNTLYLRLRTMNGLPRRGFNASYISAPRQTTLSTGNERLSCFPSKATTLSSLKVSTQTVLSNDISITATKNLISGSTSSTISPTKNDFTQTVSNNDLSVTATSHLNNGSTSSMIPSTKNGFVAGIIAVVVFAVFVIAIIVWKFKIKKTRSSPSTVHEKQSQNALNPGEYEDVNLEMDTTNKASFEASRERKSFVNVSANVITAYDGSRAAYSKQIVPQTSERKVDTPDGSYETPDVNLYSYADPNELR